MRRKAPIEGNHEAQSAQKFYDDTFYAGRSERPASAPWHTRRIAHRLGNFAGKIGSRVFQARIRFDF